MMHASDIWFAVTVMTLQFVSLYAKVPVIHRKSLEAINDKPDGGRDFRFSFAKHFQSQMVLQQAPKQANLNGFASVTDIGKTVVINVSLESKVYQYTDVVQPGPGSHYGVWQVQLDPFKTNESATIMATCGGNESLVLEDVLFGDVWLCSGQSNMQFMVQQIFGGQTEIANAYKFPNIRFMNVLRQSSTVPLFDLIGIDQPWASPLNTSIASFSAVCWLFGKFLHASLGYPIGLVGTNYGGTPIEAWSSPKALKQCGVNATEKKIYDETLNKIYIGGPDDNSQLWNSMVYPMLSMTIYGVIWYQGESDSVDPVLMNRYNCTFPVMIDDWRSAFNLASHGQTDNLFPFGFVQLSTSSPNEPNDGYVDIRWHQTADYGVVPNKRLRQVFMAVAMDLPDFDSPSGPVHTRHKLEVGYRLSLSGLAVAYNYNLLYQGPFPFKALVVNDTTLIVDYGDMWTLDVRSTEGFELLCTSALPSKTTWWLPTSISGFSSTTVSLWTTVCGHGQQVRGLRYSWKTTPCALLTCGVYSVVKALPAPPFIALADQTRGKSVFNIY